MGKHKGPTPPGPKGKDPDTPSKDEGKPAPAPPPLAPLTVNNSARAAQAALGRKAKKRFDAYEPGNLEIEETFSSPSSANCPLHACHADPPRKWTRIIPPIDLEGRLKLELSPTDLMAIWPKPYVPRQIPVRYGQIAKGYILMFRDEWDLISSVGNSPQLSFFHPALLAQTMGLTPAMIVRISYGDISGGLSKWSTVSSITSAPSAPMGPLPLLTEVEAAQLAGLGDFAELKVKKYTNEISAGHFHFALDDLGFKLDGMFPGTGSFDVERTKPLDAKASIETIGVAKQEIEIDRDGDGQLSAGKDVVLELKPERRKDDAWNGSLTATFSRGQFDIRGTAEYTSPSGEIAGSATLLLTDTRSAWAAVNQRLGDKAPVGTSPSESATGVSLVGWGVLDFNFSEWLKGRAEVVVDPDGYITTRGRLEPTVEYELFKRNDLPKRGLPGTKIEIPEIPLAGELLVIKGGFSFDAEGWYGPGTLHDIAAEGVYSTNPRIPTEFDVAASLIIPAQATLTLKIWGGISLPAGAAHIDLELTGTATLNAYAEARPHIARRRVRGAKDGSTEYVIHGHMDVAAALDVGLSGSISLHVLSVKLASVNLGGHTWRIANFGVRVHVDHVIGSPKFPKVSFEEVPFNDYKFMNAAVRGKTKEGEAAAGEERTGFDDQKVRGALPDAHAPTIGGADTTPPAGTQAAGALDPVADKPVLPLSPDRDVPEEEATFTMAENEGHHLWLRFGDPPTIYMASGHPREQLSLKLADTLRALRERIDAINAGKAPADEHTLKDLDREARMLASLKSDCIKVELAAARLGYHPGEALPSHVPGFTELAGRIHAYGNLFERPDLIASVAGKTAVPAKPRRPKKLVGLTPKLDALELLEPGVTERYVAEYEIYLDNNEREADQDLLTYVEGRAARKAGRKVEVEMREMYLAKYGIAVPAANFEVVDPETGEVRPRRPDIYADNELIGDIKDVIEQSLDEQLKDDVMIARGGVGARLPGSTSWLPERDKGKELKLVVICRKGSHLRKRTVVTGPLKEKIKELKGRLLYWIPDPNVDRK